MSEAKTRLRLRCAIYTRKSSEEGLDQDFNSLDAQREACTASIASQKHEGWQALSTRYDDGGYSGGTMERPALRALLSDIKARRVDVVVVYKVDRLTRSLADFAKIVEIFDAHGVSFVSVTQAFNTTTSMGRLTLNVLLSFAQFEREVTGERIRDKIAASKRKGLWMGGFVPFGYRAQARTLVIDEGEAEIVRLIFALYLERGAVRDVEAELQRQGIARPARTTKGGRAYGAKGFSRGPLYKLLSNPIYCGEIRHKDTRYPGQHPAIIAPSVFAAVAERLAANGHARKSGCNAKAPSLLAGLIVDVEGAKLVATHATKQGKRYRYYISKSLHEGRRRGRLGRDYMMSLAADEASVWRLPAAEIESIVVGEVRAILADRSRAWEMVEQIEPGASRSMAKRSKVAKKAESLAMGLAGDDAAATRDTIITLVDRIELAAKTITILLSPTGMRTALGLDASDQPDPINDPPRLTIPVALRRRGVETKLVLIQDGAPKAEPDQTLIRA